MRKLNLIAFSLFLGVAACDLEVPDLNNPAVDSLLDDPSRSEISAASTGLLIGHRSNMASPNGYVSMLGILGRESYNFDAADPRYITEMLVADQLDPGSPAFGGNFWTFPYRNIRNAQLLLRAVDIIGAEMTNEEKEAVRGFAKTIQALDYIILVNTHFTSGVVIVMSEELGVLDPIEMDVSAVYAHIASLLDEAKTHLEAGGEAFPFALSSGFAGFDTPATFIQFNRALKARVDVYRGECADALTALGESFLVVDPATPQLDLGVYNVYSGGTGDVLNGLTSPNLFAHPSILAGAEAGDLRVAAKLVMVESRTVQGLTSDQGFTMYQAIDAPVPIIRNEELILLRAEANICLGQASNITAAIADINFIREHSGGLAPRADLDATNIEDELLKQRFYSLLFEGGHRWIDMRRFGRLDELPLDLPDHNVHEAFPLPLSETDARE